MVPIDSNHVTGSRSNFKMYLFHILSDDAQFKDIHLDAATPYY